ncbi:hypothetical protein B0H67DRAFT_642752 [Lasiosphaeris hirsuta]|uniref:Uncharacterized protein n=1 Tax=Lasiosphaeris hirsuta TaxID=260670 RepID=A0AA40DZJ0_9PEZI|nr:hypothetical protein B0H67DRAFT_642752 [Lasiosphaeris hirsuta]
MGSHADADPTHAVDGLVRAIRDLTSDPNYKLVADVFSEFLFLKDHNHRLSMSHRETMEEYRKFRNELEATKEKLEREKKDLEGTVQDRIQETIQLSASKAALEADLKDTRTSLEHEKKSASEAAEAAAKHATQLADTAAKELAELKAEKEARLAELQLSKDTELSELQHAKVTELAALQLAKETELAELQADKEEKLAALQKAKDTELAELQAEKETQLAELQQAKDTELEELRAAKETAIAELQLSKDTELATLQTAKDTELADLQAEKEAKLAELQQSKETELADLQAAKETAIADLTATKDGEIADLTAKKDGEIADLTAAKDGEIADLQAAKAAVEEEKKKAEEDAAAAAEVAAQEIASLSEAKTGLETDKANNEAEIATLKDNVASLEEVKAGLEEVKTNNEAEIARLEENIATLEQQKKEVEEALEKANAEIESLNGTVAQKNTEIESLQESLRAAEEQISSLQQTVEDKNGEIDDLHGKLTAEGERADKAIAHGNDLQSKLDDTEHTLQVTSGRLQDLEQYRIPLHSENEDVYVTVLDKIWTNIVTLVEGTFRPDIDDQILADPSCWSNLRNSPYLKHATQLQIPLPQSNTPAAKGMRISAVLAVLSRALHRHLFRPVYLLDDEDENLVKFLRILEDEDPSREAHMRATLLSMMPERQMELGARRVKTVVREVSWLVQHLLSALQFEAFCSGLEQACRLACEQWMRIQMATMKIEPYFGPPYDDFDWQVLELPEFTEAAMRDEDNMTMTDTMTMTAGPTSANGDDTMGDGPLETVEADMPSGGSVSGDADAFHDTASQGHGTLDGHDNGLHGSHMDGSDEGAEDEIEPEEILLVVWPSMCSVEDGGFVSITQGLVISKEQARPALEEVRTRSRLVPRPGSRRARTMSMPAHSRNGSPQRRGPSFLANAQSVAGDAPGDGAPEDG